MSRSHPSAALLAEIIDRIQTTSLQRISFAEFMDLALYHPDYGYYAANAAILGPQGDFVTSVHLGQDFGELLAEQLAEFWQFLQRPQPFHVVEMGAGQGRMAADVLSYLRREHADCFAAMTYTLVEASAALQAEQRRCLMPWQDHIQWQSLEAIAPDSITGCVFSNELVDAFPVHLVELRQGQLWEVFVCVDGARGQEARDKGMEALPRFQEVLGEPSTPRLLEYFDLVGIDLLSGHYPDGYRTEVNLAALDWVAAIATRLHQGYLLTIDYGYPAHRYYSPARHQGTLQCYCRHRHHNDPYWAVGQQDITAHVDFTALERQGEQVGLQTVGFTQQAMFLMALGLGDRLAALSREPVTATHSVQTLLQRRETLRGLIDPMGVGNFGVLVQSKGLPSPAQGKLPKGLDLPPMSAS
jgi:SAM-dependent MidA family methyltransferase